MWSLPSPRIWVKTVPVTGAMEGEAATAEPVDETR